MKKIYSIIFFLFFMANQSFLLSAAPVYVMPDRYAYVAGKNTSESDYSNWGGRDKWDDIVLWGRCPDSYIGYQYKWIYGDESETAWTNITAFDPVNPFNSSNLYLKSDSHQYNVKSGETIQFNKAKLLISNGGVIVSTTALNVKVVDMNKMNVANGYTDPEESKRLIVESIAKGRGLLYLYLHQNKNEGNFGDSYKLAITGISLTAFFVFGHSIYDPGGVKDIFVDSINLGMQYIFKSATILNVDPVYTYHVHGVLCPAGCDWESDINNNGKMILFGQGSAPVIPSYTQGFVMLALGASYNSERPYSKVMVGQPPVEMFYADVIMDAIDYSSYAQEDGNTYPNGWRYSPNGGSDLSISQWHILGLTAIEEVWGIKAPDFVKNRLTNSFLRRFQYQDPGNTGSTSYDGAGLYNKYHSPAEEHYNIEATTVGMYMDGQCLVGTSAILQTLYYLSLDSSTIEICSCGSPNCEFADKDNKIDPMDLENSCYRLKGAVNFLSRRWINPPINVWPTSYNNYYSMYSVMKAFRLSNYVKSGVNNGILNSKGNFPLSDGTMIDWEKQYSDFVLKNMQNDGSWIDYYAEDRAGGNTCLGTAFALLILSEKVYLPSVIKTELIEKEIQRTSIK